MKRWVAVMMVAVMTLSVPTAAAAPYVSCPGGYIAARGNECPPYPRHPVGVVHPGGGGPRGGGGLLGTIGRVLGGLTGGLL